MYVTARRTQLNPHEYRRGTVGTGRKCDKRLTGCFQGMGAVEHGQDGRPGIDTRRCQMTNALHPGLLAFQPWACAGVDKYSYAMEGAGGGDLPGVVVAQEISSL